MPIRIAMPVAHITGTADYSAYYFNGNCAIRAADYFNVNNCEGIHLERDPAAPETLADDSWDLSAFADGFLSFQDNNLVLRLPRELDKSPAELIYNSGRLFARLSPKGPHLRHVVYHFSAAPGAAAVSDKIRAILQNATHPGRRLQRVQPDNAVTLVTLGDFLEADPANLDVMTLRFMAGTIELFVRAGDVIGNFKDQSVRLRWLDSCGNPKTTPAPPGGRALNPAYFLYLVRSAANATRVTMLTAVAAAVPNPPDTTHPLYFLLDPPTLTAAGLDANLGVDLTSELPPPPLHVRVPVQNNQGANIAGYGIPMGGLGQWHESRNSANPFNTQAPVRWRLYGNQPSDTNANDFGKFITEVKPGKTALLPGADAFDHQLTPEGIHTAGFQSYWSRYQSIFNLVAEKLQVPVELMIAIACAETATGGWYDQTFEDSHEMDVIRMEPLKLLPSVITPDPVQQELLTHYMNITGGIGGGGKNANLPAPWTASPAVVTGRPLTWGQLRDLIQNYPGIVQVSPGIMQTLVTTALEVFTWGQSFYGEHYVRGFSIDYKGVTLVADDPPTALGAMFSNWFAVAVNAAGDNTTNAGSVDVALTKMKRALHSVIVSATYIKQRYNTLLSTDNTLLTDFDLPTSFSGFTDGAAPVAPAMANEDNDLKWKKLFALSYYDKNYPKNAPRFYNACVSYFNTTAVLNPQPTVRLWRG